MKLVGKKCICLFIIYLFLALWTAVSFFKNRTSESKSWVSEIDVLYSSSGDILFLIPATCVQLFPCCPKFMTKLHIRHKSDRGLACLLLATSQKVSAAPRLIIPWSLQQGAGGTKGCSSGVAWEPLSFSIRCKRCHLGLCSVGQMLLTDCFVSFLKKYSTQMHLAFCPIDVCVCVWTGWGRGGVSKQAYPAGGGGVGPSSGETRYCSSEAGGGWESCRREWEVKSFTSTENVFYEDALDFCGALKLPKSFITKSINQWLHKYRKKEMNK